MHVHISSTEQLTYHGYILLHLYYLTEETVSHLYIQYGYTHIIIQVRSNLRTSACPSCTFTLFILQSQPGISVIMQNITCRYVAKQFNSYVYSTDMCLRGAIKYL